MQQEDLVKEVRVRQEIIVPLEAELYNLSFELAYDIAKVFGVQIRKNSYRIQENSIASGFYYIFLRRTFRYLKITL